ncbi:MAG: heat-inducible transcriptional repressor HrcA [Chloroflexota bacterium]|nr:heat-inducible transcriptional repressor HrcA [Chloroflexota bacterium]
MGRVIVGELNARRRAVLAIVVQEYIESAQPVGSRTVVEGYGLTVSSATIRNEMKALEERGYLTHPHTSAGRIPTDEGYRYFVEHLLPDGSLSEDDQLMIQHQFHQVGLEADQWAQLSAAVLAHTANMAALATPVRASQVRFKHIELVEVRQGLILLVLVLHQGIVKQQMLSVDGEVSQEELSRVSNQLNHLLAAKTGAEVAAESGELSDFGLRVIEVVQTIIERESRASTEHVYREGLSYILMQPEFASTEDAQQLVTVLEQPPLFSSVFEDVRQQDGVQILIGGDRAVEPLRDISLVLSPYGISSQATGVLGILGPIRMPYNRAIPLVRFVARVMSELVQDWYG